MFSKRHKTWHMTSRSLSLELTALVVLILLPRLIPECAFLSLSLFSHPPSGAECLMEAVKVPEHRIMSISINRDTVSHLDSNQGKSGGYSVRRNGHACESVCVCTQGKWRDLNYICRTRSLLFRGMRQI